MMTSRNIKIIVVVKTILMICWWRFGNLRQLVDLYLFQMLCFATIATLLLVPVGQYYHRRKISGAIFFVCLLLSIIPIDFLLKISIGFFSKQFLIIYCVTIVSIVILFRKELSIAKDSE